MLCPWFHPLRHPSGWLRDAWQVYVSITWIITTPNSLARAHNCSPGGQQRPFFSYVAFFFFLIYDMNLPSLQQQKCQQTFCLLNVPDMISLWQSAGSLCIWGGGVENARLQIFVAFGK